MKKALAIVTTVVLIGCGNDAEARVNNVPGKTVNQQITEIKATGRVVVVPNTEHIDYRAYRLEWRRVNEKTAPSWAPDVTLTTKTHQDTEDEKEVVELYLNDMSFKDAFSIQFRARGEGHTFYWRGNEYTTNLLHVIREPASKHTDPYIERLAPHVVPVSKEDLLEGGGDQGTTTE